MATILSLDTVFAGWNRLLSLHIRTARGTPIQRVVEDHGNAAAVLPFDPVRRVALLVRLLRAPLLHSHADTLAPGGLSLEAPAGLLDGDSPEAGVRREALEEVGVQLGAVVALGPVFSMPGVSTEAIHLFLAEYGEADRVGSGGGVEGENEEIEVVEMPLDALAALADGGGLHDLKTVTLLQALRLRRAELF